MTASLEVPSSLFVMGLNKRRLTISKVSRSGCQIWVIPHTYRETNLSSLKKKSLVNQLYLKLLEHNPKGKLAITESKIFMTRSKINNSLENILISKRNKLNLKNNTLKDVNPLSILEKGFSLVYCNKKVANRIADFKLRDKLKIRMSDGELYSKVEDLKKY